MLIKLERKGFRRIAIYLSVSVNGHFSAAAMARDQATAAVPLAIVGVDDLAGREVRRSSRSLK